MQTGPEATTWVDVEDFLGYFDANPRPSGIQRLSFEIMRELQAMGGASGRVRFVRRGPGAAGPLLRRVPWTEVQAAYAGEAAGPGAAQATLRGPPGGRVAPPPPWLERARRVVLGLPPEMRVPLHRAAVLQRAALRSFIELMGRGRAAPAPTPAARAVPVAASNEPLDVAVQPGDCFLVLGAPWAVAGFATWLADLKQRHGVRVALLLYDLVPARHPEWCTPQLVAAFDDWLDRTLPQCDRLMAISRHTALDVAAYARERGIALAGPVVPIPIGTGFGDGPGPADAMPGLPVPGSYVLLVATLEARKNHALAVRVWRRLAEEVRTGARAAESLPDLVFAGRVGWMVADLLQQLDNTAWLRGRVRLIRDPSDAELRALYEGCLFTFFPSWFEGWGLPVTESLALGKPCLTSDAAALPEAGGGLSRMFDPCDAGSAHRAVAALLDDRAALASWQDEVRRAFRPTPWSATAASVMREAAPAGVAP